MSAYLRTITENLYVKPAFDDLDDCYKQGRAAGAQAYRIEDNPYPPNTARHHWWRSGHQDDRDELTGEHA